MAEVMENTADVGYDKEKLEETVSYFYDHAKHKSNGVIEIPKPVFMDQVKQHGVTQGEFERVQTVVDFMTSAAHGVAARSLEEKIEASSAEDLKDESYRRGLQAVVRIPTHGGNTQVTMKAETSNPIPFRGEEGGEPQFKTTYGRSSTTINSKGRIFPDLHKQTQDRIRKALGMDEAAD